MAARSVSVMRQTYFQNYRKYFSQNWGKKASKDCTIWSLMSKAQGAVFSRVISAWQKSEGHLKNQRINLSWNVNCDWTEQIGETLPRRVWLIGITRGFRFLSDLFLVTNTITSLDLSDFRTLWGKRFTGENGSFGRTNSQPKILIALIIC